MLSTPMLSILFFWAGVCCGLNPEELGFSLENCTFFEQKLDHFNGVQSSFKQRVCIFDEFREQNVQNSPMLFYTGNEGPVDLYINNTGLMWTLGKKLSAVLVFAEHRYFGESIPPLNGVFQCMKFNTPDQALADFADIVLRVKKKLRLDKEKSKVVSFGGSYGGMLSAFFRLKYPHICNGGALAASAPILGFASSFPDLDGSFRRISLGAEDKEGNFSQSCFDKVLGSWAVLDYVSRHEEGKEFLKKELRLCDDIKDVRSVISKLQDVFFLLAESNYPFPSDYIVFSIINRRGFKLGPWPMRAMCEIMKDSAIEVEHHGKVRFDVKIAEKIILRVDWDEMEVVSEYDESFSEVHAVVNNVRRVYAMMFNITKDAKCFGHEKMNAKELAEVCSISDDKIEMLDGWGSLVCNSGFSLVQDTLRGIGNDFFWPPTIPKGDFVKKSFEQIVLDAGRLSFCKEFSSKGFAGVTTKPDLLDPLGKWPFLEFHGKHLLDSATNIIFTNGNYDPWTAAGVVQSRPQRGIHAIVIANGAHHTDLMFPTERDPQELSQVREKEADIIGEWVSSSSSPLKKIREISFPTLNQH